MLWIDAPNAQIRHIAHGVNTERDVNCIHIRAGVLKLLAAPFPTRGIIVFGIEALVPGLLEDLDHRDGFWSETCALKPRWGVHPRGIEFFKNGLVRAEIRPAHVIERT